MSDGFRLWLVPLLLTDELGVQGMVFWWCWWCWWLWAADEIDVQGEHRWGRGSGARSPGRLGVCGW